MIHVNVHPITLVDVMKIFKDFIKEYDDRTDRYVADEIKKLSQELVKKTPKCVFVAHLFLMFFLGHFILMMVSISVFF